MFYVNKHTPMIRFLIGAKLMAVFLMFTQSSGVMNFAFHSRDFFFYVAEKNISSVTENNVWTSGTLPWDLVICFNFSLAKL